MSAEGKSPVGNCPNHGPIYGEDLNFNFPNRATCDTCGEEVDVVMADLSEYGVSINGP